ncbi:hypothetical protein J8F10_13810 [Gemmata sp. G18]|uniref:Carrier domain-containing protein n=1 Tax=Gemmata palustris TaxID=2822762 RepID=A0ABS5BRL2_9BACT|nr:hypothetical protein [Gemmata palustris]MBP3956356.1 hypothetical protein [Gemmata palustris]
MIPEMCFAAVVLATVVGAIVAAKRSSDAFKERFPPISDAEFLARCSPGTNPEVALKVRRIVADYFAVEYERIYPSTRFIKDLGVD